MKHLKLFLGVLLCLSAFGVLVACGEGDHQLETPKNLRLIDEVLTWDEVEGAERYLVTFDDVNYTTETNSFDIFELAVESKTYRMSVMALGNSETTFNSEFSKEFEYELQLAENLMYSPTYGESGSGSAYSVYAEVRQRPGAEPPKGKVVIPEEYNGLPVTELSNMAFRDCTEITGIILPDSIISVRDGKAMGEGAFMRCTNLKRVRLSDSFTVIHDSMFEGCTSLMDVKLPKNLQEIGSHAFQGCTSLANIEFPKNLQKIGSNAFDECASLTNIQLPGSVTEIAGNAFTGAENLQRLVVAEENPVFRGEGNCVIRKSDNVLVAGCASSVIPNGVEGIGDRAFDECTGITRIAVPNSVKSISWDAFCGCSSLTAIELPSGLDSYLITFRGCVKLESVTMRGENKDYAVDGNCIIRKADNTLVAGCKGSVIPDYVEVIRASAFYSCGPLGEVTIPYGVKKIERSAFAKCLGLTSIHIPDSVTNIESSAFMECFDLTSIIVPESVEKVEAEAFDYSGTVYVPFVIRPDGWDKEWYDKEAGGTYYDGIVTGCKLAYENHYPYVESFTFDVSAENATLIGYLIPPNRAGYTFLGWATEPNGNVGFGVENARIHYSNIHPYLGACTFINGVEYEEYDKDVVITLPFRVRETIKNGTTLYAVWQKTAE